MSPSFRFQTLSSAPDSSQTYVCMCVCGWSQVQVMKCKYAELLQQDCLFLCGKVVNPLWAELGSCCSTTRSISPGFSCLLLPRAASTVWKGDSTGTNTPKTQFNTIRGYLQGMGAMPRLLRQGLRKNPWSKLLLASSSSELLFLFFFSFSLFLFYCLFHSSLASLSPASPVHESNE